MNDGSHEIMKSIYTQPRVPLEEESFISTWAAQRRRSWALANLGARWVVKALTNLAEDPGQHAFSRAVATAALGRIGDPEPGPSLARITAHANWRAWADFLNELFSLL